MLLGLPLLPVKKTPNMFPIWSVMLQREQKMYTSKQASKGETVGRDETHKKAILCLCLFLR